MSKIEWLDTFTINLNYYLEQTEMSQRDLAMLTGLSEATISNYVNRKQAPGFNAIRSIASAFGVTIEEFIG